MFFGKNRHLRCGTSGSNGWKGLTEIFLLVRTQTVSFSCQNVVGFDRCADFPLVRKLIAEDWQSIQQRHQENLYAI